MDEPDQGDHGTAENHATWTELFFDLVVVAGVGQLAHLLTDSPTLADMGLYAATYFAFWTAWAGFTVYGDARAERTRLPVMLLGMLGMAVLAVSVSHVHGGEAAVFVIAYVVLRWFGGQIWRPGTVVIDWPLAQLGLGTLPWFISLWIDAPAKYWLWAAGIAVDLLALLTISGQRMLAAATQRLAESIKRHGEPTRGITSIEAVYTRQPHLAERLGLFVIIVLGEGVIQIVSAVSEVSWSFATAATAFGAFTLLVGLWVLCLLNGFAGVPQLDTNRLPMRHVVLLHGATTAVLAALAASLGTFVAHADQGEVPHSSQWLLSATMIAIAVICLINRALSRHGSLLRLTAWALPTFAAPVAVGVAGDHVSIVWAVWITAAAVFWQLAISRRPASSAAA